jgi:hypothetical protein
MKKDYLFTGFGFNLLIKNAPLRVEFGEECLDLNMNDLEKIVAESLISSILKLSGPELKFLRKYVKLSTAQVADSLSINESNLKFWEKESSTGLTQTQEYAFRELIIDSILRNKKKELLKPSVFQEEKNHTLEVKYA